ncbi:MAG: diacylglycerol kinase [Erysipelotrichaceae bacterium]
MASRIKKFFKRFQYAFEGLYAGLKYDKSIRMQFLIGCCVLLFGVWIKFSIQEWMWIFVLVFFVIIIELLNSALEQLVNLVSPQYSAQAKVIKDLGAAAVFMAALLALIVGLLLVGGKLYGI